MQAIELGGPRKEVGIVEAEKAHHQNPKVTS